MNNYIVTLVAASLGILGYSLMAKVSWRALLQTLIGGVAGTAVYYVCDILGLGVFTSNIIAAFIISVYAEVSARIWRAPALIYLLPGLIILVPGSSLYYTMSNLLGQNYEAAWQAGIMTVKVAAGIADGIICGLIVVSTVKAIIKRIKDRSAARAEQPHEKNNAPTGMDVSEAEDRKRKMPDTDKQTPKDELNSRIFKLWSVFLNLAPDYIDRDMISGITGGTATGEEYAFAALVASACGLDIYGNNTDKRLFREYILPGVHRCSPEPYLNDPFYLNVKFPEASDGKWRFERRTCRAYEAFVINDPVISSDGRVIPQIGFFDTDYEYPALTEDDREWMTLMPNEINTTLPAVDACHGKVLTYGLGLGYFAYRAAIKPDVESVTVVDRSADAIRLFKKYTLPQFPNPGRIKIIEADAFDFADVRMGEGAYDFVFTDLWHDPSDGVELYLKMKTYENRLPRAEFSYWIENTLKLYL